MKMQNKDLLYEVKDLVVEYHTRSGIVNAVDQVSLDVKNRCYFLFLSQNGGLSHFYHFDIFQVLLRHILLS